MTNTAKPSLEVKFDTNTYGSYIYLDFSQIFDNEGWAAYCDAEVTLNACSKWGGYTVRDYDAKEGDWRGWEFGSEKFELAKSLLHETFNLKVVDQTK